MKCRSSRSPFSRKKTSSILLDRLRKIDGFLGMRQIYGFYLTDWRLVFLWNVLELLLLESFEFFLSEFPDFVEKYVKLVFEMFVPKREVFHGKPHVGDVARSAVHLCENGFHPVNGRVTQQPIVLEHNWINLLGFRRQQIEMTIERFVKEIHIRPKTSRHKA